MEKTLERQIRFTNTSTGNKMSYYHNLPIVDGYCPNYFWITPRGYLAQVFIEVVEGYTEKKCYAVMGANCFLEGDIMIECEGVRTPYIRNSFVYFDKETKQFVFEQIDVYYNEYEKSYFFNKEGETQEIQLKNYTKQHKQQIIVGVRKSYKRESVDIGKQIQTSACIPFSIQGKLPLNEFYFGNWGKNCFGLYQKYYSVTYENKNIKYEVHMVPVITSEKFEDVDKRSCVMYVQFLYDYLNEKLKEYVTYDYDLWFYADSEVEIVYDSVNDYVDYKHTHCDYVKGGVGRRDHYVLEREITFSEEKVHY